MNWVFPAEKGVLLLTLCRTDSQRSESLNSGRIQISACAETDGGIIN